VLRLGGSRTTRRCLCRRGWTASVRSGGGLRWSACVDGDSLANRCQRGHRSGRGERPRCRTRRGWWPPDRSSRRRDVVDALRRGSV